MIQALARVWRVRSHRADIASLADRLGPHIARDIGIEEAARSGILPVLQPRWLDSFRA